MKNFYPQSAIYFYRGNVVEVKKEKGSPYFKNDVNFFDEIEKEPIYFSKYKVALSHKGIINVVAKYETFSNTKVDKSSIEGLIKTRIQEYLQKYESFDPLDIYFLNEIYDKILKYEELKINVNVLVN